MHTGWENLKGDFKTLAYKLEWRVPLGHLEIDVYMKI